MAYQIEKGTEDLVINGFEQGIAPSPHKGIANIQCANISTETGAVMANYARVQQNQVPITAINQGTFTFHSTDTIYYDITSSGGVLLKNGAGVLIFSGITGLTAGNYIVASSTFVSGTTYAIQLYATIYKGSLLTGMSAGSAIFRTLDMINPIQSAIEYYLDSSQIEQNRYYVLSANGRVWMQDTAFTGNDIGTWQLIDTEILNGGILPNASGIAVYDGWLHVFVGNAVYVKFTSTIGNDPTQVAGTSGWALASFGYNGVAPAISPYPRYAFVGHASTLNYTDGNSVSTIYATSGVPNVFTSGTVTFVSTDFAIKQIAGQNPVVNQTMTFISSGTMPTGLALNQVYYVISVANGNGGVSFDVSATKGGGAITPSGGSGTLYCVSYNPAESGTTITFTQSIGACTLPENEIAKCLTEVGNSIIVGCESNTVYFWSQAPVTTNLANGVTIVSTPFDSFLVLPETNVQQMLTVSNLAYIFAGQKGNVYVTAGSSISPVITVPDYVTGQVEPFFTWGGVAYIRGRIFFSIKDSNSKTGGIWSFIPTQNYYPQQDVGVALRLENQSSYGTYAGYSPVLIASVNQNARGVQYWAAWFDGNSTYGIDFSSTTPYTGGQVIIETDIIPVGTMLKKRTFEQVEYKLSAPLVAGESVQLFYRYNLTDSYMSCGSVIQETTVINSTDNAGTQPYSGYFKANFQNNQWLQLKAVLTSTASSPSFVRMTEIRIR